MSISRQSEEAPSASTSRPSNDIATVSLKHGEAEAEVFGGEDGLKFRTVGWLAAAVFMIKMTFATGVLSIPAALYTLGAVAGSIFIVFWGLLNTYMAHVQGRFKIAHPSIHTISDATYIATLSFGGSIRMANIVRELTDTLYLITWALISGVSMLGLSVALNAVSSHATCSIIFGFVSFFVVSSVASIQRIHKLRWLTWIGFGSILIAILIVVIAVTIPVRPAAAPQTGNFDLGFLALPPKETTFVTAWTASLAIFSSSANTSGFIPVISEMKRPQDFFKSMYTCMAWVTSAYLSLALTVYAYCGKWVASPALGSAGPTIKIIAYAIAIPGMIVGAMILVHVAAKSLFVKLLRGTRHLSENTKTHWAVWLSCTYGVGLVGWILSEAVPIFSSLVSLIGALGFGPLGICLPAVLWFSLERTSTIDISPMSTLKRWTACICHLLIFLLGLLVTIGGTYANVISINDQFKAGNVGKSFQCADNSGTIVSS